MVDLDEALQAARQEVSGQDESAPSLDLDAALVEARKEDKLKNEAYPESMRDIVAARDGPSWKEFDQQGNWKRSASEMQARFKELEAVKQQGYPSYQPSAADVPFQFARGVENELTLGGSESTYNQPQNAPESGAGQAAGYAGRLVGAAAPWGLAAKGIRGAVGAVRFLRSAPEIVAGIGAGYELARTPAEVANSPQPAETLAETPGRMVGGALTGLAFEAGMAVVNRIGSALAERLVQIRLNIPLNEWLFRVKAEDPEALQVLREMEQVPAEAPADVQAPVSIRGASQNEPPAPPAPEPVLADIAQRPMEPPTPGTAAEQFSAPTPQEWNQAAGGLRRVADDRWTFETGRQQAELKRPPEPQTLTEKLDDALATARAEVQGRGIQEPDRAFQERSPEEMDVRQRSEDGRPVAEGNAQGQEVAQAGGPQEGQVKQPWEMTRAEFSRSENEPKVAAIQEFIQSGRPVFVRTQMRQTRLADPSYIRISKSGSVQTRERSTWVTLLPNQVDDLASQAGVKIPTLEDRVYHHAAVEQAIQEGKPVPPAVLADYPQLTGPDVGTEPSQAQEANRGQTINQGERSAQEQVTQGQGGRQGRAYDAGQGQTQGNADQELLTEPPAAPAPPPSTGAARAEMSAPAETVQVRRSRPAAELSTIELVQRIKYEHPNEDPSSLYGRFVQARDLKPEINAKQFRDLYESVGANAHVTVEAVGFQPTHTDTLTGKRVMVEPTEHGNTFTWEDGHTGHDPGPLSDRYQPLRPPAPAPPPSSGAARAEMPAHWLDSLTPERKDATLSEMRRLRAESDRAYEQARKLSPVGGETSVGGAHMDPFFRAEGATTFLRELGKGSTPEAALEAAKTDVREAVGKWNGRREYQVHRSEGTADPYLEDVYRRFVQPPAPTPPPTFAESVKQRREAAKPARKPTPAEQALLDVHERYRPFISGDEETFGASWPTVNGESSARPGYSFPNTPEGRSAARELKARLPKQLQMNVKIVEPGPMVWTDGNDVMAEIGTDRMAEAIQRFAGNGRGPTLQRTADWIAANPEKVSPEDIRAAIQWRQAKYSPETAAAAKGSTPDPFPVDRMAVGDQFDIAGEQYRVKGVDPDTGAVKVKDGITFDVPPGAKLPIDKGTYRPGEGEAGTFGAGASFETPPESARPPVPESTKTTDLFGNRTFEPMAGKQKGFEFGSDQAGEQPTPQGWRTQRGTIRPDLSENAAREFEQQNAETGQGAFGQGKSWFEERMRQRGSEPEPPPPTPPPEPPPTELHAGLSPQDVIEAARKLNESNDTIKGYGINFRRALMTTVNRLKRMGVYGQDLAEGLERTLDRGADLNGRWHTAIEDAQRDVVKQYGRKELKSAWGEFEQVMRARFRGEPDPPTGDAADRLLQAWGQVYAEGGQLAAEQGLQVVSPITGKWRGIKLIGEKGYPRVLKPEIAEALRNPNSNEYQRAMDYIAQQSKTLGGALRPEQIREILRRMSSPRMTGFFAGLEKARGPALPEDFYEFNPDKVVHQYISGMAHRVADVETFGQMIDNPALGLAGIRGAEDHAAATRIMNSYFDPQPGGLGARALGKVGSLETLLKMGASPLSWVKNLTQQGNTMVEFPLRRYAKSLLHAKESWEAYRHSGAKQDRQLESFAGLLNDEDYLGSITTAALKPFTFIERGNRITGAGTAHFWAQDEGVKILTGKVKAEAPEYWKTYRLFKRLHIDPEEVQKRGYLTKEELRRAAFRGARETQFSTDFQNLPRWASHPLAAVFRQFKTFSYQQARFLNNVVIEEARHRNYAPLVKFLALSTGSAWLVDKTANLLKPNKTEQHEEEKRVFEDPGVRQWVSDRLQDVGMSGMAGLYGDVPRDIEQVKRGEPPGTAVPPVTSTLGHLLNFFSVLGDDRPQKLSRVAKLIGQEAPAAGVARSFLERRGPDWLRNRLAEPVGADSLIGKMFPDQLGGEGTADLRRFMDSLNTLERRKKYAEDAGKKLPWQDLQELARLRQIDSDIDKAAKAAKAGASKADTWRAIIKFARQAN